MKKTLSFMIMIMLLGALFAFPVAAAGNGKISMGEATAKPGDTVQLAVKLTSNPGLVTMQILVEFDTTVVELIDVEDTGVLKGSQLSTDYTSPYKIAWVDGTAKENNTATGTLARLMFKVKPDAPAGESIVRLKYGDSYSVDMTINSFSASSGAITVENTLCDNHSFNQPEVVDDAEHSRTCAVCDYVEKEKHSYSQWNIADEAHSRTCEICEHLQQGNHDWDEGTVVKPANCQEGGQTKYTCKQCETGYTADTDPNGVHTYDHGCDTDCNLCGDVRTTEHTFKTKWSKDSTHHWYECSQCQEKKDLAEHVPGAEPTEEKAQTCTECGYELAPALNHKHDTASVWTADAQGHWHVCDACEEKVDYAEHSFQDVCDAECNTCGYVREQVHTYPEGWLNDAENHWRICDSCGEQILFAAHVPGVEATAEAPQYCTECGYELAPVLGIEKIPTDALLVASYGWPWWANTIAILIILGSIAILIVVPLRKKKQ